MESEKRIGKTGPALDGHTLPSRKINIPKRPLFHVDGKICTSDAHCSTLQVGNSTAYKIQILQGLRALSPQISLPHPAPIVSSVISLHSFKIKIKNFFPLSIQDIFKNDLLAMTLVYFHSLTTALIQSQCVNVSKISFWFSFCI